MRTITKALILIGLASMFLLGRHAHPEPIPATHALTLTIVVTSAAGANGVLSASMMSYLYYEFDSGESCADAQDALRGDGVIESLVPFGYELVQYELSACVPLSA